MISNALHHGNACRHHRRELAREDGDVFHADFATRAESLALCLDARGRDALATQVGAQRRFVGGKGFTAYLVAALILAFPKKLGLFFPSCC